MKFTLKKRDREGEITDWRTTETHHMMDSHSFMRQVPLLNDCFVSERCLEHQIGVVRRKGKHLHRGVNTLFYKPFNLSLSLSCSYIVVTNLFICCHDVKVPAVMEREEMTVK